MLPLSLRSLGHRLLLYGIHAAETANCLLVEHHCALVVLAKLGSNIQFPLHLRKQFACFRLFSLIHAGDFADFGFAFEASRLSDVKDSRQKERAMAETRTRLAEVDPVWQRITAEAREAVKSEPLLGGLVHACILHHEGLESALAYRLAQKLASAEMSEQLLREIADAAYRADSSLGQSARADVVAVYERDPACHRFLQPLLFFKGFQAIQCYRVAHWLWREGRKDLAYFVQMRVSEQFGVDIHPAARVGKGIMIDHAHSIVIGETAVVGDNVSMLHSVTLGGTGKQDDDRHPKIGDGVLIGAGAKVLGNIKVGHCSRIAAGSVVLNEVPPCKTVAGVPAKIVGEAGCDQPSVMMDHLLNDSAG